MKMPFGKYKGTNVNEIDKSYLLWLWDNVEMWDKLKNEVKSILFPEDPFEEFEFEEFEFEPVFREDKPEPKPEPKPKQRTYNTWEPSCYVTLQITNHATRKEIKAAYRKWSLKTHPDMGGNAEMFKKIKNAYDQAILLCKEEHAHTL